jgi:hypothetical protein
MGWYLEVSLDVQTVTVADLDSIKVMEHITAQVIEMIQISVIVIKSSH